jgi:hypothetical protein
MMEAVLMMTLHLAAQPADLAALYRSARSYDKATFRFQPPGDEPLRRTRALVAHLAKALHPGAPPAALVAEAKAAGFELALARDTAGEVWVLHEPEGQRAGAGGFALRPGGSRLVIEAPHTFYDEGTGEIALALFARLHAGALFFNTVHRYAPPDGDEHPADVAHSERTLFAAANQGLLDAAGWTILQVHGFGGKQPLPAEVKAVVSDGTRTAGPSAVRLRAALAKRWGAGTARLYGVDAEVLGATTNVEGKAARRSGVTFLHVEMSADTRRALGRDAAPLADAIGEALGDLLHGHR